MIVDLLTLIISLLLGYAMLGTLAFTIASYVIYKLKERKNRER